MCADASIDCFDIPYDTIFWLDCSTNLIYLNFWINLDTPRKRCLQDVLFPDGIYIENNRFRTTQISPILKLIEDNNDAQSILAASIRHSSNLF